MKLMNKILFLVGYYGRYCLLVGFVLFGLDIFLLLISGYLSIRLMGFSIQYRYRCIWWFVCHLLGGCFWLLMLVLGWCSCRISLFRTFLSGLNSWLRSRLLKRRRLYRIGVRNWLRWERVWGKSIISLRKEILIGLSEERNNLIWKISCNSINNRLDYWRLILIDLMKKLVELSLYNKKKVKGKTKIKIKIIKIKMLKWIKKSRKASRKVRLVLLLIVCTYFSEYWLP